MAKSKVDENTTTTTNARGNSIVLQSTSEEEFLATGHAIVRRLDVLDQIRETLGGLVVVLIINAGLLAIIACILYKRLGQ